MATGTQSHERQGTPDPSKPTADGPGVQLSGHYEDWRSLALASVEILRALGEEIRLTGEGLEDGMAEVVTHVKTLISERDAALGPNGSTMTPTVHRSSGAIKAIQFQDRTKQRMDIIEGALQRLAHVLDTSADGPAIASPVREDLLKDQQVLLTSLVQEVTLGDMRRRLAYLLLRDAAASHSQDPVTDRDIELF